MKLQATPRWSAPDHSPCMPSGSQSWIPGIVQDLSVTPRAEGSGAVTAPHGLPSNDAGNKVCLSGPGAEVGKIGEWMSLPSLLVPYRDSAGNRWRVSGATRCWCDVLRERVGEWTCDVSDADWCFGKENRWSREMVYDLYDQSTARHSHTRNIRPVDTVAMERIEAGHDSVLT
jgi:hypothetical protein